MAYNSKLILQRVLGLIVEWNTNSMVECNGFVDYLFKDTNGINHYHVYNTGFDLDDIKEIIFRNDNVPLIVLKDK